jgi:hypothetical protein
MRCPAFFASSLDHATPIGRATIYAAARPVPGLGSGTSPEKGVGLSRETRLPRFGSTAS